MKIYRKFASSPLNSKTQAWQTILKNLGRGSIKKSQTGQIMKDNIEMHVDDLAGDAWIQISYDEWQTPDKQIRIEIYYDSEMMQNEYGKITKVPFNIENPQESIDIINGIIREWIGEKNEPEEPEDNLSDVEADAMTLRDAGMGTDEDYGFFGGDGNED